MDAKNKVAKQEKPPVKKQPEKAPEAAKVAPREAPQASLPKVSKPQKEKASLANNLSRALGANPSSTGLMTRNQTQAASKRNTQEDIVVNESSLKQGQKRAKPKKSGNHGISEPQSAAIPASQGAVVEKDVSKKGRNHFERHDRSEAESKSACDGRATENSSVIGKEKARRPSYIQPGQKLPMNYFQSGLQGIPAPLGMLGGPLPPQLQNVFLFNNIMNPAAMPAPAFLRPPVGSKRLASQTSAYLKGPLNFSDLQLKKGAKASQKYPKAQKSSQGSDKKLKRSADEEVEAGGQEDEMAESRPYKRPRRNEERSGQVAEPEGQVRESNSESSRSQNAPSVQMEGSVSKVYETRDRYHLVIKKTSSSKAQTTACGDSEEAMDKDAYTLGEPRELTIPKVDKYLQRRQEAGETCSFTGLMNLMNIQNSPTRSEELACKEQAEEAIKLKVFRKLVEKLQEWKGTRSADGISSHYPSPGK